MDRERQRAWLTLADATLPRHVVRALVARWPDPTEVLSLPNQSWMDSCGLSPEQARRLRDAINDGERRRAQLDALDKFAIRILTPDDEAFPEPLRAIDDPPPILFQRGEYKAEDRLALGIVGTRNPTTYGREVIRKFVRELAPALTIVSGLARGIDSAAHEATLAVADGRTIGVAAAGLDVDYPQGTRGLRDMIAGGRGALFSAHPPMVKALRPHFHYRNHLLAGLCRGVLVVEAAEASGSLVTARAAAEAGREVFAVPGDITRPNSAGTNRLIADGAQVATSPADIFTGLAAYIGEALAASRAAETTSIAPGATAPTEDAGMDPNHHAVLARIRHERQTLDGLMAALVPGEMSVGVLTGALLELELMGLIRAEAGNVYTAE